MTRLFLIPFFFVIGIFLVSLGLRFLRKLRLTLPALYLFVCCTLGRTWAFEHERLAVAILCGLLLFSVLRFLYSLCSWWQSHKQEDALMEDMRWQVEQARKNGIPLESVYFDPRGELRNQDTGALI